MRITGMVGVRDGTYRGQLISTGEGHILGLDGRREKGEAILCNIYPSCLLIYFALPIPSYALATRFYDLLSPLTPTYKHTHTHVYIYICMCVHVRVRSNAFTFSHPLSPALSISAPPFLRCSIWSTSRVSACNKRLSASFCLLRDNYR